MFLIKGYSRSLLQKISHCGDDYYWGRIPPPSPECPRCPGPSSLVSSMKSLSASKGPTVTPGILSYSNLPLAALFGAFALLTFTDIAFASGPHEKVIYSFQDSNGTHPDGENATTGLVADQAGNLYGTTLFGGSGAAPGCDVGGCGTVFQLSPPATQGGAWTESVLYNFGVVSRDGILPSGVIFRNGVLYGETQGGGTGSNGTVFLLARRNGNWSEGVLYNFTGSEGSRPVGGLISDSAGNLYGTVHAGGNSYCISGCGAVFGLAPPSRYGNPGPET